MKYSDDPNRFQALMNAAQSNIITAIKQLKKIEYSNQEILELVQMEIDRNDGTGIFKKEA